ncbi:hypothetical protein HNR46_003140 [Haloferula luteola]|uniref:Uncharacterized protein n=1 Tax=Haloferula luteola TaxID=595692 RepID=A0A840VJM6_9BACT|nr:hypothetical protein [Haloferula luteola]
MMVPDEGGGLGRESGVQWCPLRLRQVVEEREMGGDEVSFWGGNSGAEAVRNRLG